VPLYGVAFPIKSSMDVIRVPIDAFFRQLPGARLTGISEFLLQGKQERSAERTGSSRFAALQGGVINPSKFTTAYQTSPRADTGATATVQNAHLIGCISRNPETDARPELIETREMSNEFRV
jgi:hypothetical protein